MPALDSLYRTRTGLWAPYYAILEQQLGATATLIDIAGQRVKPNAASWTGRRFNASGLAPVWTPSEALSAWDTAFDLTNPDNWLGIAPILTFNGTDEEADTPDAAYWTRIAGAFSIGLWVNVTDTADIRTLLGKWDESLAIQEWTLEVRATDVLALFLRDDSVPVNVRRESDAAISQATWQFLVATYDGGAGATAMNGVTLYANGAVLASTATNDAGFVDMEDGTSLVRLGHKLAAGGAATEFFSGKMLGGPWSPFFVQAQLTAAQVLNLYENMRLGLGV